MENNIKRTVELTRIEIVVFMSACTADKLERLYSELNRVLDLIDSEEEK